MAEFCAVCNSKVYLAERLECDTLLYHKPCFKCKYCGFHLRFVFLILCTIFTILFTIESKTMLLDRMAYIARITTSCCSTTWASRIMMAGVVKCLQCSLLFRLRFYLIENIWIWLLWSRFPIYLWDQTLSCYCYILCNWSICLSDRYRILEININDILNYSL